MNVFNRYKKPSEKQENYLLVAAIDFGTTYSGYAFSTRYDFQRDPTNTSIKQWVDPTSSLVYNKTSTCILFTKEKEFCKFGFDAEAKYFDLILDNEHKDWYFFRRFKMYFYNKQVTAKVTLELIFYIFVELKLFDETILHCNILKANIFVLVR